MLTLLPPAALAASPEFRVDEGALTITLQDKKKKEKASKKQDEKDTKKHKRNGDGDGDGDGDDKKEEKREPKSSRNFALLSGTYDPRGASYGTLRQYTLASQGMFLDYFTGNGATKAEIIGLGSGAGARSLTRSFQHRGVSLSLNGGWGVYHLRGNNSETKLAWVAGITVSTSPGLVARLQLLDTKLNNGNLRGSSLSVGWRF
jgi:hypothetical protein